MQALKDFKGYIKGKSFTTDSLDDNTEKDGIIDQQENPIETMFTKNYWFTDANQAEVKDPWLPNLSKTQRIVGFITFLLLGIFCFILAGLFAPVIVLKARKFVLLYTMGSCFTIGSFALLWGPYNHLKHIFSYERLPFTAAYFGSMMATLYAALWWKSTIITVMCACVQIMALTWYIFSYIPGGTTGLKFFSKLFASSCTKTVGKTLPV